jgi:hypothetical protein
VSVAPALSGPIRFPMLSAPHCRAGSLRSETIEPWRKFYSHEKAMAGINPAIIYSLQSLAFLLPPEAAPDYIAPKR